MCHLVRYHECGVEAQAEMTDDLILVGLVLVLLHEIRCAGKCDLVDVLLDLVRRHTKTVIDELQGLLLRVHDDLNLVSYILRECHTRPSCPASSTW